MSSLPVDLVLVRHGESEGNAALRLSRDNDLSAHTDHFRTRHSSTWRLTREGVAEAQRTGAWLRSEGFRFTSYLVSPFARALETAHHLELPDAAWQLTLAIRERSWGDLEPLPIPERQELFAEALRTRETSPFFWMPPNGEPLAAVCERVAPVIRALEDGPRHALAGDAEPHGAPGSALLVCHGEVMTSVRVLLDPAMAVRIVDPGWLRDPWIQVRNGDVVQYTRRAPESGELHPTWRWVRHVRAAEGPGATAPWEPLQAPTLDNEALARLASAMHRLERDEAGFGGGREGG